MIARLIIGSLETRKKEIQQTLVREARELSSASHIGSGNVNNHPDLLYFLSESKLGIAEARKIKEHFSLKPYSAKGRVVILENAINLTQEAQNALLKTLEELPEHSLFILGASSDAFFLPTVLSRCQIIKIPDVSTYPTPGVDVREIEKIINATLEERFEYIEKLKDREEFLSALVSYFHQNLSLHPKGANVGFLNELLKAEQWQKQNVNIRAILEYLMLVMPARHRYAQALAGEPSK